MLRPFAEKLQALLATRYQLELPISDQRGARAIVLEKSSSGDMYSGETVSWTLAVDVPPLKISFAVAEHQLSGHADQWSLDVHGARDEDRAAFAEVFHPRQRDGWWNNHVGPQFRWNGAMVPY